MIKNYWNKTLREWNNPTPPRNSFNDYGTNVDRRVWKKVTIGQNEYYGKSIGFGGKLNRIVCKIIPLFILSIALAPISVPFFLSKGIYRKLVTMIMEIHYSTSIKYIINVSNKNLSKSPSLSAKDPAPLEADLNNDMMLKLLLSAKFSNSEDAKRYLVTLSCVSKTLQPFVDKAALDLVNAGVISVGNLPGIENNKAKVLAYLKSSGAELKYLDLSDFELTDEDLQNIAANCPKVETLLIGETELTDSGADEVAKLLKLNQLCVHSATNLEKLSHLEELEIGTANNLDKMVNLRKLTIDCRIVSLDALINLEELNVKEAFDLPSLEKLVSLKALTIDSPYIRQPPSFDQLANLKKLTINCPNLQMLSPLDALINLQELSVINNYLKDLLLNSLVNLEKLSITSSGLLNLSIDKLINLKDLSVNASRLRSFSSMDALDQLEKLNLISSTPPSFDGLVNLKELTLHNPIKIRSLVNLNNLEKLSITTDIEEIDSFDSLKNLKELYINVIVYGPSSRHLPTFDSLHSLEKLSLVGCFQDFPSFDALKNLKVLVINAELNQLPSFDHLTNLDKLDIQNSKATALPSFDKLNLKELNLNSCSVKKISSLANSTRLKAIDIYNCPNLKELSSLENLINLEKILILGCPKLNDISSLEKQNKLKDLNIQNTGIKKGLRLDHLHNLEKVIVR